MQGYTKTDQQLHQLCQLLAKVNRTFLPSKEDDSHTNLYFDELGNRITGRWIPSGIGEIVPTINLANQTFEFLDSSLNVRLSARTISKKMVDIEKEIEALLPELGLKPEGFTDKLHFEISQNGFTGKPIEPFGEGLELWKEYRALVNQACFSFLGHAQAHEEVRIWPHHFDTGIFFKAKKDLGIGFGLAMEDSMAGAPYFYLSAYPEGKEINYSNLPKGKWQWELGDNWKGAILRLDELEQSSSSKTYELNEFIKAVYKWIISQ